MIHILAVGKMKTPYLRDGVEDYLRRVSRFARIETVEVPDSSMDEEGRRLLAARVSGPRVVCDRQGDPWSSQELAEHLGRHGATSFTLGGPDGLARPVIEAADRVLSLGGLTLPHELARLVLLEQIYRGFTILRGHPYHR